MNLLQPRQARFSFVAEIANYFWDSVLQIYVFFIIQCSIDEHISWFAFVEAIFDWLDITTWTQGKWAPTLKARLVGGASIYKPHLDRERLRDPNEGVDYFKMT